MIFLLVELQIRLQSLIPHGLLARVTLLEEEIDSSSDDRCVVVVVERAQSSGMKFMIYK